MRNSGTEFKVILNEFFGTYTSLYFYKGDLGAVSEVLEIDSDERVGGFKRGRDGEDK